MTKQPTQTPLDGELLTSSQVYRQDMHRVAQDLSPEQEALLLEHLRSGDLHARQTLIESCLPYVQYWAWRYFLLYQQWQGRLEYEELLATGNALLVERLDRALLAQKPVAYLKAAAKFEMRWYCAFRCSFIPTPEEKGLPEVEVQSLDAPLARASGGTLATTLEAEPPPPTRSYEDLYQVLALLPEQERHALGHSFGLEGYGQETCTETAARRGVKTQEVSGPKRRALAKMRLLLSAPLYTEAQACECLGVSASKLYRLVKQGKLHSVAAGMGLYPKEEVEQVLQQPHLLVLKRERDQRKRTPPAGTGSRPE
jgi:excisionase family DNA binding protein